MSRLSFFLFLLFVAAGCRSFSQKPEFLDFTGDPWVKTTLEKMSLDEKIGQLIMVDVDPGRGDLARQKSAEIIRKYKPGGILIMGGTAVQTARWINFLQEISGTPLLTAIDGESGPGFRLDSVLSFPVAQGLGAIGDNRMIYAFGRAAGRQMRRIGINMNFAPVADINTNPENPVINLRSFGDKKMNVAEKAVAFANGLQDERVAAVAKHFPGHGDTGADSHFSPPVLRQAMARMDSVELYPFRKLIENNIAGVMTGHLVSTALDPSGKISSLSSRVIGEYLKKKMKFSGLVVTDAMNMGGVTLPRGKAEAEALKAGNDLLEFVPDIAKAIEEIKKEVSSGRLTEAEINDKCTKILALKRWMGLQAYKPEPVEGIPFDLNRPLDLLLARQLREKSLTVLINNKILPLRDLNDLPIATVAIGADSIAPFQKMADRYCEMDHFFLSKDASPEETEKLLEYLTSYRLVIAGIVNTGNYPRRNYNISESQSASLWALVNRNRVITLFFGNAYAMKFFPEIEKSDALILTYQSDPLTQELASQLVFGALDANGVLPVTVDNRFMAGGGIPVENCSRLKYSIPEEADIDGLFLGFKIDSIVSEGLSAGAYPGCQVMIIRKGKVIYHKCYGFLTYDKKEPLTADKLYDFASVTKVSGPLPLLIKLADEGRLDLMKKMSDYLPLLKNCNKENILITDVLSHQARLPAFIPLWNSKLAKNRELREEVFSDHPVSANSVRVSSRLWMEHRYIDTMYQEIRNIPLLKEKKYNYTCMGFTLWPLVIQNITKQPYETYLKSTIYKPLGAGTLTYNPWKYFPISRMVPTETDDYFRNEVLRGYVHDEGAAMLGGISGNAGLFGTVNDLAKLFQMYLWKGYYGGDRYFSEKTFNEFNKVHFAGNDNRRAFGFDKPYLDNSSKSTGEAYPCKSAGPNSFGHSGFTGTWVWADPDQELLCLVFTNRVQPTRNNNLLSELRIRASVLQAAYDAIDRGIVKH